MSTAAPIMTCGDNEKDASAVNKMLKPEYDAIYSGYNLPATLQEVPLMLAGNPPPSSSLHTQIGSNDFTRRPLAIAIGGGYDDKAFLALYDACLKAVGGAKKDLGVVFLRADRELTERLAAEGTGPKKGTPEYSAAIGERFKDRLRQLGVAEGAVKEEEVGEVFAY